MWNQETKKMAKFAVVGVSNTAVDFAVFVALVYGAAMSSGWAQCISFAIGVLNSYWWNRRWTFRAAGKGGMSEIARFFALAILAFLAATALLLGLERGLGWSPVPAKAASIFVSLAVNYAGNRLWVFRMETRRSREG